MHTFLTLSTMRVTGKNQFAFKSCYHGLITQEIQKLTIHWTVIFQPFTVCTQSIDLNNRAVILLTCIGTVAALEITNRNMDGQGSAVS